MLIYALLDQFEFSFRAKVIGIQLDSFVTCSRTCKMSSLSRLSRNVRQTLIHGCKSFSIGSGYHGTHYDVIISGGGMVGFAMACSLGKCYLISTLLHKMKAYYSTGKSSYLSNMKFLLVESSKPKKLDLDAGYNIRVCALNPGKISCSMTPRHYH